MKNIFRSKLGKQKAVFTVNLDFNYEYKKEYESLKPGKSYYLKNDNNKISYDEIKNFAIDLIEKTLPREVEEICGLPVFDIRVNRTYQGSIELVLTIIFNTYQFIAGIKDFYDNLRLIRETINKFLKTRINNEFGDYFDVNSSISYPNTDYYLNPEEFLMRNKGRYNLPVFINNGQKPNRDAFFYYLLFSNIILTAIVIFMIYKAVAQTYGW
jgi:hypothetical protein